MDWPLTAVTVLFGGNQSFDSSAPVVLSGTQTSESFGSAIAIGSFLGNGMTQLVLSSPGFDNSSKIGEQNHGRARCTSGTNTVRPCLECRGNHEEMLGTDVHS